MKLLENEDLLFLSERLSNRTQFSRTLCRLELYSCKLAGHDKRVFKQLSNHGGVSMDEEVTLTPSPALSHSPVPTPGATLTGLMSGTQGSGPPTCSARTVYYLKTTLNASFPDYDFINADSHEFTRELSYEWVLRAINTALYEIFGDEFSDISSELWQQVADAIEPHDAEIYSYNPGIDSDPFATDGALSSFNYFFFNKKLKRILFFTSRTLSAMAPAQEDEEYDVDGGLQFDDDIAMNTD